MRPPQEGTLSTHVAAGMLVEEQMLRAKMANMIVLPDGALVLENTMDLVMLNTMKGIGLNLVAVPRDTLYQLQDGITAELRTRERREI